MKLSELFYGIEITGEIKKDIEIKTIVSDSRRISEGCLFVCIRGLHDDGHKYIKEAYKRGAAAMVAEENSEYCGNFCPIIKVKNTHSALALLWNNYCGRPSEKLDITAVTGTNGKTSVSFMLREIFGAAGYKTGIIGTIKCFIGDDDITEEKYSGQLDGLANMTTPDPEVLYKILGKMADAGVEKVFMEASSHALELCKLDALKIKWGIFTNLTPEHLDFHKDMEHYFAAKAKLFSMCENGIVNADDSYAEQLIKSAKCKIYTVSSENKIADFTATNVENLGLDGIKYTFNSQSESFEIESKIPGGFTVKNTLEAAACAHAYGIPSDIIRSAVKNLAGVGGRMEKISFADSTDFSVFIDYAHTPDAMENLLTAVRNFRKEGENIKILFGCGGDRDKAKRPIMGEVASRLADYVIITSDNSRSENAVNIIFEIMEGIDKTKPYIVIPDRREAIEYAIKTAKKGDIILLAGKGHERYEIKQNKRFDFDERIIVREAVKKYYGKI